MTMTIQKFLVEMESARTREAAPVAGGYHPAALAGMRIKPRKAHTYIKPTLAWGETSFKVTFQSLSSKQPSQLVPSKATLD